MIYVRRYVNQQRILHEARQWLAHDNADPRAAGSHVAAEAMWRLNRSARRGALHRYNTYALKNYLIAVFCQRFPYTAGLQVQTFPCWSCGGTGEHWTGEDCWKCDGTGIYRSNYLYLFRFEIAGRHYAWHQPKALVTWPVAMAEPDYDDLPKYKEPAGDVPAQEPLDDGEVMLLQAVVYTYLVSAGVKRSDLPRVPTLRDALEMEWCNWYPVMWLLLQRAKARARRSRRKRVGQAAAGEGKVVLDDGGYEIPF
jgi:hypothetical protein